MHKNIKLILYVNFNFSTKLMQIEIFGDEKGDLGIKAT